MTTLENDLRSTSAQPVEEELPSMTLMEHLEELRRRLVWSVVILIVGFLATWTFSDEIFAFLARPVQSALPEGDKLAFLGVTDAFVLYVKVALTAAVFLASPFLFYQFWAFVSPGLYRRERLAILPFAILSSLFFLGGAAFAYVVAFPLAVDFLIGVGQNFDPVITVERYFRFLLYVLFGLGVMFQLPILVVLLARLGLVTPRFLLRHFRWAVVIIFVLAAILTPTPDIVNLCVFALPTLALYLLGVLGAAIFGKKRSVET